MRISFLVLEKRLKKEKAPTKLQKINERGKWPWSPFAEGERRCREAYDRASEAMHSVRYVVRARALMRNFSSQSDCRSPLRPQKPLPSPRDTASTIKASSFRRS
jgi:hypothetical protein